MVKKILSSIILIMITFSTFVYATNPSVTEKNIPNDNIQKEDKTTNNGKEENNKKIDLISKDTEKSATNLNNTNNNTSRQEQQKDITIKNNKSNISTVQKSSEARLSSLKTDKKGLTPDFDKNNTEYYLIVDLTVKQIKITANTVDKKATVSILGNENLKEGQNTITVKVKAEDGTEKKYFIYVTKVDNVESANAELSNLEVKGYNLYPSFKSNIYSYNLYINQNITSLNITPTPERESTNVIIEGNTNLQKGENVIKIFVKAEDNTTVRTYKINAYIDSKNVEIKEEDKMPALILMAILSVCIIILGIYIIIKNRR